MNDIVFKPFSQQKEVLRTKKAIIGAFSGKRGGKTEIGAVKSAMLQEEKHNGHFYDNGIDPYLGIVIAPTTDMLRRLSMKKFLAYSRPFINNLDRDYNKSTSELTWHDGSMVYGMSAEKPQRLEGVKAGWIWIDEVFQCKEDIFLEAQARLADTEGTLICTGSLGTQYVNPKLHWAYKYFKKNPDEDTICFEWKSLDNPYIPKSRIEKARRDLDPQTFRAMYELNWDTVPNNAVYGDFGEFNQIKNFKWDRFRHTYISIDWGFAHPMAVLFIQHDPVSDQVYFFDEIIESKLTINDHKLMNLIKDRLATHGLNIGHINGWICDIAGSQEREQTGMSNIDFFKNNYNVEFLYRSTAINYGIPLLRTLIKDGAGRRHLMIDENKCPKTIDCFKMYRYPEKDGQIQNENPVKKDDDAVDSARYFVVNIMDKGYTQQRFFERKVF